jgi:hypothetical protein
MFAPMPRQGAHLTDVGLGPKGAAEESHRSRAIPLCRFRRDRRLAVNLMDVTSREMRAVWRRGDSSLYQCSGQVAQLEDTRLIGINLSGDPGCYHCVAHGT